jgi:hypothetical protein
VGVGGGGGVGGGLPINPATGRRRRRGGDDSGGADVGDSAFVLPLGDFGTPPRDDGDLGGDFGTPPEFEETDDIDERHIQYQTCRDVVLNDDYPIEEYLREADTFLLIHKSSTDDILCYEKSYIESILNNKNNWFYECIGRLLDSGNRTIQVGNENDAYIKLPIYKDGLNGFIHLSQVIRLLESDNRIYYVYPDNDKDITHSISWKNAFGPDHMRNWISANHCQVGSKLLVYKLKICRDPERCLRSLPPQPPQPPPIQPPIQPPEDFDRVPSVRASPRRLTSEDFDRVSSVRSSPVSTQHSEDFDRVPSVRASPPRQPSPRRQPSPPIQPLEDFDRVPSVRASPLRRQPSEDFDRVPSATASPRRRTVEEVD